MPMWVPEGFIPCAERMPPDWSDVLVCNGEDFAVAYWHELLQQWDSVFFGFVEERFGKVTSWAPLPKQMEVYHV